jgi:hypothetical protein
MSTNATNRDIRSVGRYKVRTTQDALRKAFAEVESLCRDIWDLPPAIQCAHPLIQGIAQGTAHLPAMPDRRVQAMAAIPLMNYFRLLAERQDFNDASPEVLAQVDRIARALEDVDSDIVWVAIRNSMAWESSNRASTGGVPFNYNIIGRYLTRTRMMGQFIRIKKEYI